MGPVTCVRLITLVRALYFVAFYYIPPKVSILISVVAVAFFISVVMTLSYDSNKRNYVYLRNLTDLGELSQTASNRNFWCQLYNFQQFC